MSDDRSPDSTRRTFPQSGEMPRALRHFDWTGTSVGVPEDWAPDLRASVDLVLDSRIPMMIGWGPDLRLIYNDGYIPILGDKHPVVWQPCAEAFGEVWDIVGPILTEVYESGEAVLRENELLPLRRRGFLEECYFTFSYSPLRDAHGRVVGLLSTAIETTSEVVANRRERVLQAVARPLAPAHPDEAVRLACRALDGARDVPFHLALLRSDDGTLRVAASAQAEVDWDDGVRETDLRRQGWPIGRPAEGATTAALSRLVGLQASEQARERCTHATVLPLEAPGVDGAPDGWLVLGTASDLPWDDAYRAFMGRIADLVHRQHDAQRLRALLVAEAEDRYRELFMQALDGIILGKPSGEIIAANPAACQILGYTEAELIAGGRALIRDPNDPRWQEGLENRAESGRFSGETTWVHRSGRRVHCEVTSRVYRDASGEPRSTVILRDVSKRLELQAQLAEAQKMEVVGRISGGIAHDFNNLLAVIDVQTDLLRDELAESPTALSDLDLLSQTSHRAAALIRRLLDFTRHAPGEAQTFNPAIAVTDMTPLLRRLVGSGCELVFELAEDVPDVTMAPHQFEQVVMNLVVNARDAVEEAGREGIIEARVASEPDGGSVLIEVRDNGIGIPASRLPDIFDAFHTTKAHGTGIGLNTVRTLANELGGSVSVESTEGEGTTFTVRLPAEAAAARTDVAAHESPVGGRLDGLRILLVEDQAHLRTVLSRVLQRAGADVLVAANGEEALRLVDDRSPQVLVTDVVMPLLSGPELVRLLRGRHPGTAVVLMSGYTGDEIVPAELLDGTRFLHKPFAAGALVEAVLEALTSTEPDGRPSPGSEPRADTDHG
ncbi:MAG: ATP-binding protein [Gemmatimonadota bacterium]|nr:ATP-binding protein [Gemmatimonadota bacterium]